MDDSELKSEDDDLLDYRTCTEVIKLNADNFVPVARTPWAGFGLASSIKSSFVPASNPNLKVGESWDFSVEEAFPSKVIAPANLSGHSLSDFGKIEILVKLISTSSPLSFQVHPSDRHPAIDLKDAKICGKPESWLVLDAEPGAGVYIGLKKIWTRESLRLALSSGKFSRSDLHFVPVKAGDFFDIAPGVTHALGPGLVIYEPQRVLSGKSGVTWRLWDWDRRYAGDGVSEDPSGKPRDIHLDLGLGVCSPEHQTGEVLEIQARRHGHVSRPRKGVEVTSWSPNSFYTVHRLKVDEGSEAQLSLKGAYISAVVVNGNFAVRSEIKKQSLQQDWNKGDTLMLCAPALPLTVKSVAGFSELLLTLPADSDLSVL